MALNRKDTISSVRISSAASYKSKPQQEVQWLLLQERKLVCGVKTATCESFTGI